MPNNSIRDSRGRIRRTVGGVRVEVNAKNDIRVYKRYTHGRNTERRTDTLSGWQDLGCLSAALNLVRQAMSRSALGG